jgi:hypothetical protein
MFIEPVRSICLAPSALTADGTLSTSIPEPTVGVGEVG